MTTHRNTARAMKGIISAVACTAVVLSAGVGGVMGAGGVRVVLGRAVAEPGEDVRVPLRLKASRRVPIGAVGTTIRYDPTQLVFVSATPGRALVKINGEIVAAERPVSKTEAVLRVGAVTRDPSRFGGRLGNGTVAWLTFRVRPGSPQGRLVLEQKPEVAGAGVPAVSLVGVKARPGRIRVRP